MAWLRRSVLVALAAASLVGLPAGAEQSVSERPFLEEYQDPTPQGPSPTVTLVSLIFKLALVLGLIWLCARLLRKYRPQLGQSPVSPMTLLARQNLAAGTDLFLVDVGGRLWLLGGGNGHVTMLSEIDDPHLADRLRAEALLAPPAPTWTEIVAQWKTRPS